MLQKQLFLVDGSHGRSFFHGVDLLHIPHEIEHANILRHWKLLLFLTSNVVDAVHLHFLLQPLLVKDAVEGSVVGWIVLCLNFRFSHNDNWRVIASAAYIH